MPSAEWRTKSTRYLSFGCASFQAWHVIPIEHLRAPNRARWVFDPDQAAGNDPASRGPARDERRRPFLLERDFGSADATDGIVSREAKRHAVSIVWIQQCQRQRRHVHRSGIAEIVLSVREREGRSLCACVASPAGEDRGQRFGGNQAPPINRSDFADAQPGRASR